MSKRILGLDLGTNSIGWALLEANHNRPNKLVSLGTRIFTKAVEEKTPTPKNVKRRHARLARRVIQRRSRRKQRMLNYLVSLGLLPAELQSNTQPEIILNRLGNPYKLRAKALDKALTKHELGRILLHLVQRRGFLSNRKTLLGDMVDDPDVQALLADLEEQVDNSSEQAREETAFKKDISELREVINNAGCRTLGEYLSRFDRHACKRNRSHEGGHLRTDRQMYRDELELIWKSQTEFHEVLTEDVKEQIEEIIFRQRPLRLNADRIGRCSLEPNRKRANIARLASQQFRYLQDINNLRYFDPYQQTEKQLTSEDREKLVMLFEKQPAISFARIRKSLGFDKGYEFNLERGNKKLKGNITACEIRKVLPDWDGWSSERREALVEDLITIRKKSVLKRRLVGYWNLDSRTAVNLCIIEFEPDHSSLSTKAINRLLPYLEKGEIFSEARVSAGYGYEPKKAEVVERLASPPEIANPIVQKALHELRRLVNAIIAEHGKPDVIRIEMARDLEMNTKRYKAFVKQQQANTKANDEAVTKYTDMLLKNPYLKLSKYPSRADKIRYRLWKDQNERCAYSGTGISLATLFTAEIDIDHILPFSESLDDSYMNKVVCYAGENRYKGQRTPVDAFGGNAEKWNQICQAISRWGKSLSAKIKRFYITESELQKRDFINSQLNDTRYISKVAQTYLAQLGADVTVSKGITTSWLRHQWNLNNLLGTMNEKTRKDHRHHAIDALVVACLDRQFYQDLVGLAKSLEKSRTGLSINDMNIDPPWSGLRNELSDQLEALIVSYPPQCKLSGALHEETGVGFIEGVGTVYRVNLDSSFKLKQVDRIVDDDVRTIVQRHLKSYGDNPKNAFSEKVTVYHKDGKTPIKRVRIVQSKTTKSKLEINKFGKKDLNGKAFKWHAYGNIHHVELVKNRANGKCLGHFVTMMEAHHREKGINMPKQPIVKTSHGTDYVFLMALHINDLVSVDTGGERRMYRVQKLEQPHNLELRLHTAATLNNKDEMIRKSINTLLKDYKMQKHKINSCGKLIE